MQIPPTPTPQPPPMVMPVQAPEFDLWTFAPEAVGWWTNILGTNSQIVQIVIIALFVLLSIMIITWSLRTSGSDEKEMKQTREGNQE